MEVSITKPSVEHTMEIAAICSAGWRQTVRGILSEEYQLKTVDYWYNHERVSNDIQTGNYTHVALMDSKVVGVIGGGMTGPSTAEVFVFYVSENFRYKGIGRRLLDALTDEQIKSGATEQWVSVQEGNQRGIPFYEARGFEFRKKQVTATETGEEQVSLRYSRKLV